jgi:hypothetical protein
MVFPPLITGEPIAMQLAKLSADTCTDPEHIPLLDCPVSVAGFMAWLNVTATVVPAVPLVVAFAGLVLTTVGCDTHVPSPSHTVPPFWLHVAPSTAAGFAATPALHTSSVHWLLSTGRSLSKFTVTIAPLPSHCACLQSPVVWVCVAVPAATFAVPQVLLSQVRVWHSLAGFGHCVAVVHCTHAEAPSQKLPPFWLHAVLAALGGNVATPALHA